MIVNSEKHLFQWDIQQKMITHGVEYIDYIIDTEVVRVRCEDGKCIIPDECLQHSGVFTCWACSDTGTYTEYTFPVKARLMPPDYVFTPTQRETFDQLVERVDLAAYEAMRQADLARQAADTANTAAANADTVAAIIRQMAIEGEFDGFSPEVKLEPVEGGTLLTITDRSGDHTAFIKDGQGADITKEAIIEALQYTPADQANTYTKSEADAKNAEILASANTFTEGQVDSIRQELSEKMEFYPVMLEGSPIQFRHYEPDGTFTVLGFTELADKYNDPRWFLYCEYASITFIPSLPPVEDPVHPDKVLEFSAAWYYDGSHWLTSIKINEGNQIKIEEHQIPTRTEMQTALAEKVGFTDYASQGVAGVVAGESAYAFIINQTNGKAQAQTRTQSQYETLSNNAFIGKGTLENIKESLVKSVTDKPWVLKGTLTTENKTESIPVDFSGCTEMLIKGTATGNTNASLSCNYGNLISSMVTTGFRRYLAKAKEIEGTSVWDFCQYGNGTAEYVGTNLNGITWLGKTVKDITHIRFSSTTAVDECNIEIYGR